MQENNRQKIKIGSCLLQKPVIKYRLVKMLLSNGRSDIVIPKGIDDKYEVIRTLQEKAATAVLLVKHKQIGDVRILKAIPKSHPNATQILSEANLLAGVKSPGVPTIFDVCQTNEFNYLVEEYVQGQPLQELFLDEGQMTLSKILQIMIEVCKVIEQLHDSEPEAILYLDMKPEHIYVDGEKVTLIDFGAALPKSQTHSGFKYGSKSFASPEQLEGEPLDERSDVYGIGKVLELAMKNVTEAEGYKLKNIVRQSTERDRIKRISSVMELRERLECLQGKMRDEKTQGEHLNKTIAVCSNAKASGCTHISINLCKYLNDSRNDFYYVSKDGSSNVQQLSKALICYQLRKGVLYHDGFKGIMEYGPCIEQDTPPKGNYINDYGFVTNKPDDDIVVYIINQCPWKEKAIPEWVGDKNVYLISNFGSKIMAYKYSKSLNKRVFVYPVDSRVFKLSQQEKVIFDVIKESKEIESNSQA